MEAVLQIKELNKYFGKKKVVDDLNLELYRGEVFGFLGPNGAGKTTTIKMVMSLLQRDSGKIIINGFDIDKQFEKAMACVGGIVENPETYHYMTGMQNLRQYARMREGISEERIQEVVHFVGLENRINEKVKKYSLGMKQRLGVAQSIMHHPDLLILDEPTNGLDPAGIKELRDLLKRLAHEENACVMVSSHLLSEMQLMCDRVGIISDGKLIDVKNVTDLTGETQGHRQFHIYVKENAAGAMALIDNRPTALEDDRHFTVTVENEDQITDIITRLVINQVKLITVTEAARNLEEVFIELTGTEGVIRLGKFFRLVQNEHIKIFTRISTWVLIILMAVVSVGFTGLMKFVQYQNNNIVYYDAIEDYQRSIQYLKADKPEGYETSIETYEFLIKHDIKYYGTWKYDAVFTQFNQKGSLKSQAELGEITQAELETGLKQVENNLNLIINNNWKEYYQQIVDQNNANPESSAVQKEAENYYYNYIIQNNIDPDSEDWRLEIAQQIRNSKFDLLAFESDAETLDGDQMAKVEELKESLLINEYRLKHNLRSIASEVSFQDYIGEVDFWAVMGISNILIGVVSMIIIIMAGSSIANEFSTGTIKFLLINPVKRWKIFLSKYVTIISISVMLVLGFFFLNAILAAILFGVKDIMAPYLFISNGAVQEFPGLLFALWQYLIGSVNLIVMGTLAFAISSLMRNSAVAIGISVFAMLAGNIVVSFLGMALQQDWARFFIFANTDLNAVMAGNSIFPNMTVGFSLSVIAVHMVIFFLTAWDGFMRRESI